MPGAKTAPLLDAAGKETKQVTLDDAVFGAEIKPHLVHEAVRAELNAARAGTRGAKSRGQVSGGRAKPWRQKGTGRARIGTTRAPHWTGGGAGSPTIRSFSSRRRRANAPRDARSEEPRPGPAAREAVAQKGTGRAHRTTARRTGRRRPRLPADDAELRVKVNRKERRRLRARSRTCPRGRWPVDEASTPRRAPRPTSSASGSRSCRSSSSSRTRRRPRASRSGTWRTRSSPRRRSSRSSAIVWARALLVSEQALPVIEARAGKAASAESKAPAQAKPNTKETA